MNNENPTPDIKDLSIESLKYSMVKQRTILAYMKKFGIITDDMDNYQYIVEEAPIPALSLSRAIAEEGYRGKAYLVSDNYSPRNNFHIVFGENGHFQMYRNKLYIVGFDRRILKVKNDISEARYEMCEVGQHFHQSLFFIEGQPERAFNLVGCDYDTLFGDIYSMYDQDSICFYNELYNYMCDTYDLDSNNPYKLGAIDVYEEQLGENILKLIYFHTELNRTMRTRRR